ncbi:MAG: YfiR family protein [Desulfuromonadaceae bacterium]|nr:YfiR family protein [Desulfuromonadaceae bacterium]
MGPRFFLFSLLIILLFLPAGALGRDLSYRFPTDQVTAAYLYNFALFSHWPKSALDQREFFVIATLDKDFADIAAATLTGRYVADRPVKVQLLHNLDEGDAAPHIVFFGEGESPSPPLLTRISRLPILTVGRAPDFTAAGGMIRLFTVERRLHFVINLVAAKKAGITISSEVLRLADEVEGKVPVRGIE